MNVNMEYKNLIEKLEDPSAEAVYKASDRLAELGGGDIINDLIELLTHKNLETRFLAARTLGRLEDNEAAFESLIRAIHDPENKTIQGDLVATLEGYDLSTAYVEIFKLYLFGTFKVSKLAKSFLDYKEFDITPRVLKKARKHWNHYTNNVKRDDSFALVKMEVEEMFLDLESYIQEQLH